MPCGDDRAERRQRRGHTPCVNNVSLPTAPMHRRAGCSRQPRRCGKRCALQYPTSSSSCGGHRSVTRPLPRGAPSRIQYGALQCGDQFYRGLSTSTLRSLTDEYCIPQMLLLLLLACDPPPAPPVSWSTPGDCAALPASGKRDVCYSEVLPALLCTDPARGQALLAEIQRTDFRDAVLLRVTQQYFPTTATFCAQITDGERQARCREVVVSARLRGSTPEPACAAAPVVDLPRSEECTCTGPDTLLHMLAPDISPPVSDLSALLEPLPGKLSRCHQQTLYPGCPCFTGEAEVLIEVLGGVAQSADVSGAIPARTVACFQAATSGHPFSDLTGTVRLPLRLAP